MSITVIDVDDEAYGNYVAAHGDALLYHGLKFRDFLVALLGVRPLYRMAIDERGKVAGVLPLMATDGPRGAVLNSLPFFGSNGGILADTSEVASALIGDFNMAAGQPGIAAATLIANPLDAVDYTKLNYDLTDSRIGQFTPLPEAASDTALDDALMAMYHQKTRNMVRKAAKTVSRVFIDHSAFDFLRDIHRENMSALGGTAKPDAFFNLVPQHFEAGRDFDLFVAEIDGVGAAALLVFYFNEVAEYYTPVVRADARSSQPLSLLVHEAMKEASRRRCRYWNWGGTWSTQQGVYQFKSRWGTEDKPYTYYVRVVDRAVLRSQPKDLLRDYPFTYVVPFGALTDEVAAHG